MGTALVVLALTAAGGLWIFGLLPGAPLREGPLQGTDFEELRAPTEAAYTGVLWGSLVLHNPTDDDIVFDEVTLADNRQGMTPSGGPYIWDQTRVGLLGTGAVSGYQLPLPGSWKVPAKRAVKGFILTPGDEDDSIEVLYEFPVPDRTSTVRGISVRYRTGGIIYRKTFDVTITVCAPADPEPCNQL